MYQIEARKRHNAELYKRIKENCDALKVPVAIFFDMMFSEPIDVRKPTANWRAPFLSFLAGSTAQIIFKSRWKELRRRIGLHDDIIKHIRASSVGNVETRFEESFYNGYWVIQRVLDVIPNPTLFELFSVFNEDPVFTSIFIVTHGKWKNFIQIKSDLVFQLKRRCRSELNLMGHHFIRNRFNEARGSKKRLAQMRLAKQFKDEKWETVWKTLE